MKCLDYRGWTIQFFGDKRKALSDVSQKGVIAQFESTKNVPYT
jgi:hypothetical protein